MIVPRQLKKLHNAGQRFLASLTPFETYIALVEEGRKLSKAEWGSVFIPTKDGFKKVYASLPSLLTVKPRKKGTVYKAFTSRKSLIYTKEQIENLKKNHEEFRGLNIRSAVMIPITYGNEALGVLCMHSSKKNHFTNENVQLLEIFGSMACICIRKTQLFEQAQKALQQRDLFISIASHELKTPLTAATLYAEVLKNKLREKALPEVRLSESLTDEMSRLKRLINELLQVEYIKSGRMHYDWEKCRMHQVVKQAVKDFKHLYPFHTVQVLSRLRVGEDIVIGDFDKLLQVTLNVMTNAAKYSSPTEKIRILLEGKDNGIVLHVSDNGRGIPKKDLPKIYNKFYKGENSLHEGMGLGLYLAKNIVTTHGGMLTIASTIDKGTTVAVLLPKI